MPSRDDYVPTGFAELGVPEAVDFGLFAAGFTTPFAIQTQAIPVALTGGDVCGRAKTGSGKTLAFGVPLLARLDGVAEPRRPLAMVLVPTRELALQVAEVIEPVATACDRKVLAVYGGASRQQQIIELQEGADVIVATPLRLIDLLKENELDLSGIQIVVLDEADRMADDGFTPQVEWILRKVTAAHQTMLFSATLDGDVGHLVKRYMTNPTEVSVDAATDTVGTMHHLFLAVHHLDKDKVVAAIASGVTKTIVFCQTKRTCDRVEGNLLDLGVRASAIHGDLAQSAREKALRRFTEGELSVLVAPTLPHVASTSTTSASSSTTNPPETARTTCTAVVVPPAPGETAGRSRWPSTTSTPRCASSSVPCVSSSARRPAWLA